MSLYTNKMSQHTVAIVVNNNYHKPPDVRCVDDKIWNNRVKRLSMKVLISNSKYHHSSFKACQITTF